MAEEKLVFILVDNLPLYYDAAMTIYSFATKPNSKKIASTITANMLRKKNHLVKIMLRAGAMRH